MVYENSLSEKEREFFYISAFLQLFLIFFLDIAEKIDRTLPIATG